MNNRTLNLSFYGVFDPLRYQYDTDHIVSQLNIFEADSGEPMGMINWFAVHPTSMNNTNRLISGDNKGYASQLFEKHINGKDIRPGKVSLKYFIQK